MKARELRIGLIGCGGHSREVLVPSLAAMTTASVVAVCDPNSVAAQTAARMLRVSRIESDFRKVLRIAEIDAVIVAATPQVHYEVAKDALARGLHVFVEKPPTVTTKELKELSAVAKRRRLVTCVGHNLRHSSAALEMQKLIRCSNSSSRKGREFGAPVAMEMRYLASKPRGDRWGLRSPLRSFLLSHANHAIDFMVYQMGRIAKVNAVLASDTGEGIVLSVQFLFESGAVGNLMASSLAPHFSISGSILSDAGRIVQWNSLNDIVGFGFARDLKRWGHCWIERTLVSGYESAGYATELSAFVDAALGKNQICHPTFEDEVMVYDAIDEIERILAHKQNP